MSPQNPGWITGESHFLCTERDHLSLILWHDRPDNLIANCPPNFTQTSFNRAWISFPFFPVLLRWKSEASAFFLATDGVIDNRSCRDPTMHCVLASSVTKKSRNPSQNKHFKIICTHTNSSKVKLNHGFPMLYFFQIDLLFWWYK